jgi:hypothetical protein
MNRCFICKIKLFSNEWNCKCNPYYLFCVKHRLPFDHNCSINYKEAHQTLLKKQLIKSSPESQL